MVIRWHLQHDTVVIPSSDPGRITSNADVEGWQLSTGDMAALDALGR